MSPAARHSQPLRLKMRGGPWHEKKDFLCNHLPEEHALSERVSCCVPFCRRTRKPMQIYSEWLCTNHWRDLPRELKQEHTRLKRQFALGRIPPEAFWPKETELWRKLKALAVETAAGIR